MGPTPYTYLIVGGGSAGCALANDCKYGHDVKGNVMRLVTHYDVDREGCELALAAIAEVTARAQAGAAPVA